MTASLLFHGNYEDAVKFGFSGIRQITDMFDTTPERMERIAERSMDIQAGHFIVTTCRWKHPNRPGWETYPDEKLTELFLEELNMVPREKRFNLVFQVFNEVLSKDCGHIPPEMWDICFRWGGEFANELTKMGFQVCSPGLTGLHENVVDPITAKQRHIRQYLERILMWADDHAGYVDIHLHVSGAEEVHDKMERLRQINGEGSDILCHCDLVALEWSPAKMVKEDRHRAGEVIPQIWQAMVENDIDVAAYARSTPPKGLPEIFQWKNLYDGDGNLNQPIVDAITAINETAGVKDVILKEPDSADPPETPNRRRRLRRMARRWF